MLTPLLGILMSIVPLKSEAKPALAGTSPIEYRSLWRTIVSFDVSPCESTTSHDMGGTGPNVVLTY